MEIRVTTQQELDAALAREDLTYSSDEIIIDSPRGVWLELSDSKGLDVWACGSSSVYAFESASVWAHDSASVWVCDSATVRAYDSARVRACESSTVKAHGSTIVWAGGSATVEACDLATVEAHSSAIVKASGSATVEAYGSSTVDAYDSATVRAGQWVTVRLHSKGATVTVRALTDMTNIDSSDPTTKAKARAVCQGGGSAVCSDAEWLADHDQGVAESCGLKICWHIDRLVEHADQMTRSDLLDALNNLSVTADSIARGEGSE